MRAETQDLAAAAEGRARGPAVVKTYYMSRRKRLRAIAVWAAVMGSGAYMVWRRTDFDPSSTTDILLLAVIFGVLFTLAAQAIERLFTRQPTLIARTDGVVLLPRDRPDRVLGWNRIRAFEIYRFGRRGPGFLTILVHDHRFVGCHLPLFLRVAFWIDRTYVGEPRYFRARADFEQPVAEVVAELNAFKERYG